MPENVTQLLEAIDEGNQEAWNALFPLVYNELRAQAQHQRRRWHGDYTLNTTALVHEAYLKLVDQTHAGWNSRAHFLGVAAKAMRHILIDYAKQQQRQKRGGDQQRVDLDPIQQAAAQTYGPLSLEQAEEVLHLNTALQRLTQINERQGRVVECRFFGGMTIPDTAEALGISPATVKRDWLLAQTWLYHHLKQATVS